MLVTSGCRLCLVSLSLSIHFMAKDHATSLLRICFVIGIPCSELYMYVDWNR
ncbi:hypothetical protein BC829DRAFT_382456 [Chytridium lagenaria]|nr:hypothetical protein BC829DRAFT_382456 [Chytridium lagenaria]